MAVGDAHVFPGFLTPVLTQLFFPKPATTFLTCFSRGERRNTPERKFASTGDRTHNRQVMSPTHSPLSHPGGAWWIRTLVCTTLFPTISSNLSQRKLPVVELKLHCRPCRYFLIVYGLRKSRAAHARYLNDFMYIQVSAWHNSSSILSSLSSVLISLENCGLKKKTLDNNSTGEIMHCSRDKL